MSKLQRAHNAAEALEVTAEAFDAVWDRMLRDLLEAHDEQSAWTALLALRGLEAARKKLQSFVDTGLIEREAATRRAAD